MGARQQASPATPELLLERRGLRRTAHRVAVLAELLHERDDVTAQELHRRMRAHGARIGLATVYRTLSLLRDEGVVDVLAHHPGERCYRVCGTEHHHHLVCTSCHRVVELGDCELDAWLADAAKRHGFVATSHHLEVTGECADCRRTA